MIGIHEADDEAHAMTRYEVEAAILETHLPVARKNGHPLPTIRGMATEFGVSKETVRKVVRALRDRGEVITIPGSGIYPAPRADAAPAEGEGGPAVWLGERRARPTLRCLVVEPRSNACVFEIAERFNRAQPGFAVELEVVPSAPSREPPPDGDMVLASARLVHAWHRQLGFRNLRELTERNLSAVLAACLPSCRDLCRSGDEVFALPFFSAAYLLFAHPAFARGDEAVTMDAEAFLDRCRLWTKERGTAPLLPRDFMFYFAFGAWSGLNGAGLMPDRGRVEAAFHRVAAAVDEGVLVPWPETVDGREDRLPELTRGELPFMDCFTGDLRRLAGGGAMTAMPLPFGQKRVLGNAALGAIHPACHRPEQAAAFLLYLADAEAQTVLARSGRDLPCRLDAFDAACPGPESRALYASVRRLAVASEPMVRPDFPWMFDYLFHEFFPELSLCLRGESSLGDALDRLEGLTGRFERRMERFAAGPLP